MLHSCVNEKMNAKALKQHKEKATADAVCLSQPCYVLTVLIHESDGFLMFMAYFSSSSRQWFPAVALNDL